MYFLIALGKYMKQLQERTGQEKLLLAHTQVLLLLLDPNIQNFNIRF